jgi:hypothetical protein
MPTLQVRVATTANKIGQRFHLVPTHLVSDMRLIKNTKDELAFINTDIKKETGFGILVLVAFLALIIWGPWYFGEDLNWFMYGLFIIAALGSYC